MRYEYNRPGAEIRPRQIADLQRAAPLQNLPVGQFTQIGRSGHPKLAACTAAASRIAAI